MYKNISSKLKLFQTSVKLNTYSTDITVTRRCTAILQNKDFEIFIHFIEADTDSNAILDAKMSEKLVS